jgi:hypothetical protein
VGPYRAVSGEEVYEAPTRDGALRLQLAPRHTALALGDHHLTVTDQYVTVENTEARRPKRRSVRIDDVRLFVARAVPTDDIGVWMEERPGWVKRIFGAPSLELLDQSALRAVRAMDVLAGRLREALAPYADGAVRALEVGKGADRVLVVDHGNHFVIYVRRLFRKGAARALEVYDDGTVIIAGRGADRRVTCKSQFGVTVFGDLIRFSDANGADLASISVPWVSEHDRKELARRLGQMVEQDD